MNFLKKLKKHKCLVCGKRIGKNSAVVKYKYENDQIGEAHLCNKCANKFETTEMEDKFGEPF